MSETSVAQLASGDGGDERDWQAWQDQVDGAESLSGHGRLYVMRPLGRSGVFGVASGVAPGAFRELMMPRPVTPRIARVAIDGFPN